MATSIVTRLFALLWVWTVGWLIVSIAMVGVLVTTLIDLAMFLFGSRLTTRPFLPAVTWAWDQMIYGFTGEGDLALLPYL